VKRALLVEERLAYDVDGFTAEKTTRPT